MMSMVLYEVGQERTAQDDQWGEQNHPSGTGSKRLFLIPAVTFDKMCKAAREMCNSRHKRGKGTWWDILAEEFFEYSECDDVASERKELIQLAACCVARVEHIDRSTVEPS